MARIVDTTEAFEAFGRRAFLQAPSEREQRWAQDYEGAHPELFAAFRAAHGSVERRDAAARELSRLRGQAREAAPVVRDLIEETEPAVRDTLGLPADPSPLHVLIVDGFAISAVVGRVDDDVALFHCLEWFRSADSARLLVAHESVHAWHELALGQRPPADDPLWAAFSEGLAIHASRAIVPGRPEVDYFWYGHPGFDDWLAWCQQRREELLERFRAGLDEAGTTEAFFGAGQVEDRLRVGYFLADELVGRLDGALPELVKLEVADARAALRAALGTS